MARNSNPLLRVVYNGDEFEVQTRQSDLLRYETTARKHGWGMLGNEDKFSLVLWSTFLAWVAGKRVGNVPETVTWETFSDEVEDVEVVNGAAVDPTQAAPEPEPSLN